MRYPLALLLLLFSGIAIAQARLTPEETQDFYRLIKQTNEFKIIKQKVDSINKLTNEMPEEFDINIITKKSDAPDVDIIFDAILVRKWVIGFAIEQYSYQYDRREKQIISTKHYKYQD